MKTSLPRDIQEHAVRYAQVLREILEKSNGPFAIGLLYNLRTIGASQPEVIAPHKTFFEGLLKDPALKEHAQGVLDLIAGRTFVTSQRDGGADDCYVVV